MDEYLNRYHGPIKEWVTENEMANIHQELHGLVDEYMLYVKQLSNQPK